LLGWFGERYGRRGAAPPGMNTDQKHFKNRKLHSLVGVLPLGGFIAEHLLSNAFILGGQKSYESAVAWLLNMPKPILWTLEIVTIALPLAFHAIYGIKIAMEAKYNTSNYAYARNRNFMLQRLTSFYLLVFIIYHVWSTRFTGHFTTTYTPEAVDAATGLVRSQQSIYYFMLEKLSGNWILGLVYFLGVSSAAFHFGNGLWTFCISWGITVGKKAQDGARVIFTAIGLGLFALGTAVVWHLVTTPNPFKA